MDSDSEKDVPEKPDSGQDSTTDSGRERREQAFVLPRHLPQQEAVEGIRFDFCLGVRILTPKGLRAGIACVIRDLDTGTVLHAGELEPGSCVNCSKRYYIRYGIELTDRTTGELLWSHRMDLRERDVLVQMPLKGALGDSIAWFSVLERFRLEHGCRLHVMMPPEVAGLFVAGYPEISFETPGSAAGLRPYACYYLGLFFGGDTDWQPEDFRQVSLTETAGNILGMVRAPEIPPRVSLAETHEEGPYVVIASQASSHSKHWCNPAGWRTVVAWLKGLGYRVLCVDRDHEVGHGSVWHSIPYGCEDFTGRRPLAERAGLIAGAEAFVGLSSGLSWLAWCTGVPVVLISGICMPFGEFGTPYRVQNRLVCHGCWNDTRCDFDHSRFCFCPRLGDGDRAFECTRAISPGMVISALGRIPAVRARMEAAGSGGDDAGEHRP